MKQQKRRQTIRKTILIIVFLSFPVIINWFSPYLVIDAALAGIISGSFLTFTVLFLSSLVLGRSFCSWVCPAGGLQDCVAAAAQGKPGPRGWADRIKYFIWVPWIALIVLSFLRAGGISGIDPLWKIDQGVSVSSAGMLLFIFLPIVFLFAILGLTLGRRGGCHTICWMAPFMVLVRKLANGLRIPGLRLLPRPSACTGCKTCTRGCPMSLEVEQMIREGNMEHTECILCGECVDNCPGQVIRFTFKGRVKRTGKQAM